MDKTHIGIWIIRIVTGLIFFAHGLDKFENGLNNTAHFFESMGIPGFIAYLVALTELLGGLALILGIGTRIFAFMLIPVMMGAVFFVHLSEGLIRSEAGAGFELNLILLASCILMVITGSKKFSMDHFFDKTKTSKLTLRLWFEEKRAK